MTDRFSATSTEQFPIVSASPLSSDDTQEVPVVAQSGLHAVTQEVPVVTPTSVGTRALPGNGHSWQRPSQPPGRFMRVIAMFRNSPAWLAPAALLACFAGAATWVVASDPTNDVGPTSCAFKMITGFDCPGCGGTRAFYYLLTLNLPEAAHNHAIAVFAAPFLAYIYLRWALRRVFPHVRWRLPVFRVTPYMVTYFLMAWGAFWVLRNLPWPPFTLLYV